jgi:hypothetical protein
LLWRIFDPKRQANNKVMNSLHNEELREKYSSSNIVKGNKSKRTRVVEHVEHMKIMRNT